MYHKLLLESTGIYDKLAVLNKDGKLRYLRLVPKSDAPQKDQIYAAKVLKYNPTMKAALLTTGKYELFLPTSQKMTEGDRLLVQIVMESQKGKRARATRDVTLGGEYVVLLLNERGIKLSRKKENDPQTMNLIKNIPHNTYDFGVLLRTKATQEHVEDILEEIERFKAVKEGLSSESLGLQYHPFHLEEELIRLADKFSVQSFDTNLPSISSTLRKKFLQRSIDYRVERPYVFNHSGIDLTKVMIPDYEDDDISLKFNFLEALCVVDVNASFLKKDALRDYKIVQINQQAFTKSLEIIEMLGIGGIVMIDFITMNTKQQNKFKDFIEKSIKKDYNKDMEITSCQLTNSSLLQLVIKKTGRNLVHSVSQTCPYCKGSGMLLNNELLIDELEIQIQSHSSKEKRHWELSVPQFFSDGELDQIQQLMQSYGFSYTLVKKSISQIDIGS